MPYEEFYEYAFKTMVYNYAEMKEKIEPLKKLMEKTDKVSYRKRYRYYLFN